MDKKAVILPDEQHDKKADEGDGKPSCNRCRCKKELANDDREQLVAKAKNAVENTRKS